MEIKELRDIQINQDLDFGFLVEFPSKKEKYEQITKDLVGLFGEIGEFSNIVKKVNIKIEKEKYSLDIDKSENFLKEEWVDAFIYMLRISKILDIDIEKEVIKKIKKNKKKYEELNE